MWLTSTDGFFSVVKHYELPGMLVIKSRNLEHLENLRKKIAGDHWVPEITTDNEHDYFARMNVPEQSWAQYLVEYVQDMDYTGHVKDVIVEATCDHRLGDALYASWEAFLRYQRETHPGSGFGGYGYL